MQKVKKVILVSAGLGRVRRGFETYINDLAILLNENSKSDMSVLVYGGGRQKKSYSYRQICNIFRDSRLAYFLRKTSSKRNRLERFTFFIGMIPWLLIDQPDIIYLGEHYIYCWLYRLRQLSFFKYSLCLYTGGQSVPGISFFNPQKDFIHHITNSYIVEAKDYPPERQFFLPHFIDTPFVTDYLLMKNLISKAAGKIIVISVGAIEKSSKRMHFFVEGLALSGIPIFPIILGESTADSDEIESLLRQHFGDGYILGVVERKQLGTYYEAASLFISCSPKESFGLVMVEALYHGLPVICCDFKEVRDVLQEHAIYLNMSGPDDLANTVRTVISDLSALKDSAAQRKSFVEKHYLLPILKEKYLNMFLEITA